MNVEVIDRRVSIRISEAISQMTRPEIHVYITNMFNNDFLKTSYLCLRLDIFV